MTVSRWTLPGVLLLLLSWPADAQSDEPEHPRIRPPQVSRYDLATRDELLYARLIEDLVLGDDPGQWAILKGVTDHLGEWIGKYLDATKIANAITSGMPIEGQVPLRDLDATVDECAQILGVRKPRVYVRNSPFTAAYVTSVGDQSILVLTSGLLKLYADRPDELRFVIGHELGHLKCQHIRLKTAAYGILKALQEIDTSAIPTSYQRVAPTLALGRLLSWSRESEISADRAGLLCCQDPEAATQALLRLLHGLDAGMVPANPDAGHFDAEPVLMEFDQWQDKPLVKFLVDFKRSTAEVPFVPDRIAALTYYAQSDEYAALLVRKRSVTGPRLMTVRSVSVRGVAAKESPVSPYLIAYDGRKKLLTTGPVPKVTGARWKSIDQVHRVDDGQPLFFEIWDDCYGPDELIGGFVIYARSDDQLHSARVLWDWKDRKSISRSAYAEVELEFHADPESLQENAR